MDLAKTKTFEGIPGRGSKVFRELFGGGGGGSLEEECADDAVSKIFEDEPVLVDLDSSNIHMAK